MRELSRTPRKITLVLTHMLGCGTKQQVVQREDLSLTATQPPV